MEHIPRVRNRQRGLQENLNFDYESQRYETQNVHTNVIERYAPPAQTNQLDSTSAHHGELTVTWFVRPSNELIFVW